MDSGISTSDITKNKENKMSDFDTCKIEAIKIDTRRAYNMPDEHSVDADFRAGKNSADIDIGDDAREWIVKCSEKIASGARHIRIKLIPDDGPDEYQMAAHLVYHPRQAKVGIRTLYLLRSDFVQIVASLGFGDWQPNDFWLFDLNSGIEQFYNPDYTYSHATDMDEEAVARYVALRNAVLSSDKLFDMEEFDKRYLK